jgi:hypothetical protein
VSLEDEDRKMKSQQEVPVLLEIDRDDYNPDEFVSMDEEVTFCFAFY